MINFIDTYNIYILDNCGHFHYYRYCYKYILNDDGLNLVDKNAWYGSGIISLLIICNEYDEIISFKWYSAIVCH